MWKKILIGLAALLIIIQFFRPEQNNSNENTYHISTRYEIPEEVGQLMKVACNDCHSNQTNYPWYASIQPVGWWLNDHIEHGKGHLNFSEFTNRSVAYQNHKFEEFAEEVEKNIKCLSPLIPISVLHPEAKLYR